MLILNEEQSKKFMEKRGTLEAQKKLMAIDQQVEQMIQEETQKNQESREDGIRAEYKRRLRTLHLRKAQPEEIQKLTELFNGYLNEIE